MIEAGIHTGDLLIVDRALPSVDNSVLSLPISESKNVLRFWREYEATAPEEVTNGALLFHAPAELSLPDVLHQEGIVGAGGVYCGLIEVGEQALRPLRAFGPPAADIFQRMP